MGQIIALSEAEGRIRRFQSKRFWWRHLAPRSAVALMLRDSLHGLEVLMIHRAERDGDPWSGHMAFPGGRRERHDRNSLMTARRETQEEVGFDPDDSGEYLGRLSDLPANARGARRLPMVITPHLYALRQPPTLQPNHEVAETVWVPLRLFSAAENRQTMRWDYRGHAMVLPCYYHQGHRIWGLSLMMLDELLPLLRP